MSDTDKYYEILGLTPSASPGDIRKAYRRQAKLLHPDVNKEPGAHERFLLLREAYEYLTDLKSGRLTRSPEVEVPSWTEEKVEEVRKRAETYAGMNYREFRRSDHSRGSEALEIVADHVNLVFSFVVSAGLIAVLTSALSVPGFILGLALSCLIMYVAYSRVNGAVNFMKFFRSSWFIISHRIFLGILLFVFNVVVLLNIGFQTLIRLDLLLGVYLSAMLLMLCEVFFIMKVRHGFRLRFYPLCLAPLVVNVFLMVNFFLSSEPKEETYRFVMSHESTTILLEGNKYDEYEGLRIFSDLNDIYRKNLITFTFEEGLLGARVMKSYRIREMIFYSDGKYEILD
jgi:hypothetical protein